MPAIGKCPDDVRLRLPDHAVVRVGDLMTTEVVTVSPKMSLRDVAAILSNRSISGVPVCEDGRLLGVISEADIVKKERGVTPDKTSLLRWAFEATDQDRVKAAARTAGEAMSAPAVVIDAGGTVAQAASLMTERQVNRLPVVRNGELVGIVTRADLVRAFQRSDEEISHEIAEDVLVRTLWVSP